MQVVQAPRAAAILYSLLTSQAGRRPWLLPANICPIVPLVFAKAAVPIELVDISGSTLHMDLDQAADRLKSGGFSGVLYAHTYGEPSTPAAFFELVKRRQPGLVTVDDRCLCAPDLELPASLVADVTLYSTGYAKHVDLGFGGYAFVQPDLAYAPVSLAFTPGHYAELEGSYKLSLQERSRFTYRDSDWLQTDGLELAWPEYTRQVALELARARSHRAALNAIYAQLLPAELTLPAAYQSWRFNLRVENQRGVLDAIFAAKSFASAHYASLSGVMATGYCPQAEALGNQVVNLFNDHYFTPEQAERVCAVVLGNLVQCRR